MNRTPYSGCMHTDTERALRDLGSLGFRGLDVYLAELIPAVEMAWADGEIQSNERAMLEAYCEELIERLNREAGAQLFRLSRARLVLERLTRKRFSPAERLLALRALLTWSRRVRNGEALRQGMLAWAEAVAVVDGSPVWDARELFWLETMQREGAR